MRRRVPGAHAPRVEALAPGGAKCHISRASAGCPAPQLGADASHVSETLSCRPPSAYMASNWPLTVASVSRDGLDVAVAGQRGLALYSRRRAEALSSAATACQPRIAGCQFARAQSIHVYASSMRQSGPAPAIRTWVLPSPSSAALACLLRPGCAGQHECAPAVCQQVCLLERTSTRGCCCASLQMLQADSADSPCSCMLLQHICGSCLQLRS